MTRRSLGPAFAAALVAATLAAAPRPLAAQDAGRQAHERVAGCYEIEPTVDAPWLAGLEQAFRLTLEPVPALAAADLGGSPQYLVRPAAGERRQPVRYTYLAWSLFGNGEIVSIVWSSEREQVGLTFVPIPERAHAVSIGSTTFFEHEKVKTTEPVEVKVTAVLC